MMLKKAKLKLGRYRLVYSLLIIYLFNNLFVEYESNILVRNFVPCYRKSDNIIGMYDTITRTFYTNKGTDTFIKGPNKTTII